ncbi:predicted protein [Naegleria gruberi]|uniref:Predicted protein n=1 Tax=Naegleria gruberi TaxID=5762 RepID=D2VQT8_NAEGR|nr:uncharacterized protein NAEGRDRAFT_71343 [Naegleria gruberi]EFC40768.1 predicted protein [Naegleria gruberi]|eukprot:XP_002673512.1 predicted protein [Naegleria gruberi strain NEG-M]
MLKSSSALSRIISGVKNQNTTTLKNILLINSINNNNCRTFKSQKKDPTIPNFELLLTEKNQPNNFPYKHISDESTGLIGLDIQKLTDFDKLMDKAHQNCDNLRNAIINLTEEECSSKKDFAEKILDMSDEISNQLCLFLDAMEFIRCVDPRNPFRQKADTVHSKFSQYLHKLNTDSLLHQKIASVVKDKSFAEYLNPLQQRCLRLLQEDMEKHGGVHQQKEEAKTVELRSYMDSLAYLFSESVSKFNNLETKDAVLVEVKQGEPLYNSKYIFSYEGKQFVRPSYYNQILVSLKDEDTRKKIYHAKYSSSETNLSILDELLQVRDTYAKDMGYPSYSHWFLHDQCARNPENVHKFLTDLAQSIRPKVEQEIDVMRAIKKSDDIYPWDYHLLRSIATQKVEPFSVSVSDYFPLHKVMEGIYSICYSLFGIRLEPVKMTDSETYHPSIRKLSVIHETEGFLGTIYLDLFSRQSKNVEAANFSIRCGKTTIDQKPVTALVCNIDPTVVDNFSAERVYLLSHSEVITIFHELGHSLHIIFGQTPYQNLSGTRTSIDFVETPSQFMEHFAWDYRVLQTFARHYRTDEPLPYSQFEILKKRKQMFTGLDIEEQIMFGLMDITYHSGWPIIDPVTKTKKSIPQVYYDLRKQYSAQPHCEMTSYPGQFIHFSNYGAGYYSYLYSKVFSDHLWYKFYYPLENPLNREAGEKFRKEALCGASKDPTEIVRNMLGEEPNPSYFLKQFD